MSADLIEILSKSTGNYVHNLSTYKATKISEGNKNSNHFSPNDSKKINNDFENSLKTNYDNNYNSKGSFYDLLKKKKANNSSRNKNNSESNNDKKEKLNKNNSGNNGRINYSPSEINNPRSFSTKEAKTLLPNRESSNLNNKYTSSNSNYNGSNNSKNLSQNKNLNNISNKNSNYGNNNKPNYPDKATQSKLEKLKNFESLSDLLNSETDLIPKKPNYQPAENLSIDKIKTEKVLSLHRDRIKNEEIEKLNKEIEKSEMKLLGKKTKNSSYSGGSNQIEVSKDYIPGTIWCAKCRGFHDEDAHKRIFKNPFPINYDSNKGVNGNSSEMSNQKKLENLEDLIKKKRLLKEKDMQGGKIIREEYPRDDLIKKKNLKLIEKKNSENESNFNNKIANSNLEKIKKAINGKNINKLSNTNFIQMSNKSSNQHEITKENYTEDFEDIDYELENNYDYNGDSNKMNDYSNAQTRNIIENKNESNKINYSPSDNIQTNDFISKSSLKDFPINNNALNSNRNTNNISNKIEYSPSDNFNIVKNTNSNSVNSSYKHDSNAVLRGTGDNSNYNLSYVDDFDDIKINKIGSGKNNNPNSSYDTSGKAKENKSLEALKLAKIKETLTKSVTNKNNLNNTFDQNNYKNNILKKQIEESNKNFQDKSRLSSEIKNKINNSSNLLNKNPNKLNSNTNNLSGKETSMTKHNQNQIKPGNSVNLGHNPNINNINSQRRDQLNNSSSHSTKAIEKIKTTIHSQINKFTGAVTPSNANTINNPSLSNTNTFKNNKPTAHNNKLNNGNNNNNIGLNNLENINNSKNYNPNNSINNKPNSFDRYNNFSQFTQPLPPNLQKTFYPEISKSNANLNNIFNNNTSSGIPKLKKKKYLDESDRKFAEIFGEGDDFIEEGDESVYRAEYRRQLDSINRKLSRGNNRNLVQDYSDGSVCEANFEQIEKEERISGWYGEKEDEEEQRKIDEERERRKIRKLKMRKSSGNDDEEEED